MESVKRSLWTSFAAIKCHFLIAFMASVSSSSWPEEFKTKALPTLPEAKITALTVTVPSRPIRRAFSGYFGSIRFKICGGNNLGAVFIAIFGSNESAAYIAAVLFMS